MDKNANKSNYLNGFVLEESNWITSDGDHYPDTTRNTETQFFTGKNSSMSLRYGGDYYGWSFEDKTGITVKFYDKKGKAKEYFFKIGPNLEDLHMLVMAEDYLVSKINELPKDKALKSRLYELKKKVENNLSRMKNGKTETLEFDLFAELGDKICDEIYGQARLEVDIYKLVKEDKIPPETKFRKYSRDAEKFYEALPKLEEKYQAHKNALEEKARLKEERKTLRLAKKEALLKQKESIKQQRAAQKTAKKKEKEDLDKSIYGIDL